MKSSTEVLHQLGLLYEKNQLPTIVSSVEPNGGILNLEKALHDNPECWDTLSLGSTQLEKKTILLNCDLKTQSEVVKSTIIPRLIEEGFTVFYPTSKGLVTVDELSDLSFLPEYQSLTPSQEHTKIKNLHLTRDRVEILNESRLNEIGLKLTDSRDVFFYFHNYLKFDHLQEFYPEATYTETVITDALSGIEWAFDKQIIDSTRDLSKKHNRFNTRILQKENKTELSKLLNYLPDLLKKITVATLSNTRLQLIPFLNQTEHLTSLFLKFGELPPYEDEGKLSVDSLRHLELSHTNADRDSLFEFLCRAPNLTSLAISGGFIEEGDLDFQDVQLPHLKTLSLKERVWMSSKQLYLLLNAAPNLNKLVLDDWKGANCDVDDALSFPPSVNKLKEITLKRDFNLREIVNLIKRTPDLELLELSGVDTRYDTCTSELKTDYKALFHFSMSGSQLSPKFLSTILSQMSSMRILELVNCQYFGRDDESRLEVNSLPFLFEMNLSGTSIISHNRLINFFKAAPNLTKLSMVKPENFVDFLRGIEQSDSLLELTSIAFPGETLNVQEINQLIKTFPNLEHVSFLEPQSVQMTTVNWFKQSYPHIEFTFLKPHKSLSTTSKFTPDDGMTLDGNTGRLEETPRLPFRTLFRSKGKPAPEVTDYHLAAFHWNQQYKKFRPVLAQESNLEEVPISREITNEELEALFNSPEVSDEHIYGQITFDQPIVNEWMQLPALSSRDHLLTYAFEHPDIELKRDKDSGYYFIKFKKNLESCVVNYIIKPGKNNDETLDGLISKEHMEWLSQCSFNENGQLIDSPEYQKLLLLKPSERINAIAAYCRFDKASSDENIQGDTIDVLNGLLKSRCGVCRHRAQLFAALASSLLIDATLIKNDVHAFVRVKDGSSDYTLDLGGGDGVLIDLPMPEIPKSSKVKLAQDLEEKSRKSFLNLNSDNRFQTWNSHPIDAVNADELVKKLTVSDTCSRQWLIFEDSDGIEALHQASLAGKNSFFSRDLDALKLQTIHISQGKDEQVDSPVCQFLKLAALNQDELYTWFINWSDPKARHVGLNSVIDNEGRNLDGLTIPPNVHIVVGTDKSSASKMGDDFYSRFDAISQAPEIAPPEIPEIKLNQPIGTDDVLFPSVLGWESIFLGRHTIDNGTLGIMPGALIKASLNKTQHLTLHNAPLMDPKFRFFVTELLATKRFFFNGEWYDLPKEFHIDFAMPDLTHYPAIIKPAVAPQRTRVVNQTTLPLFFNLCKITEHQTLKTDSGFLATDQAINLVVTDHLTEVQWYTLLREAKDRQCALNLQATPNVFIPDPLRDQVTLITPLKQNNQVIISKDMDDAEELLKQDNSIIINVDEKTNFNSLFFHVALKNKKFTGQDTPLLKAIKDGNPVILKGRFSLTLAQQLQSLFVDPPSLLVNGSAVSVNNLSIVTDEPAPFRAIYAATHDYKPDDDFNRLNSRQSEQLQQTYQRLGITPCHSHFFDLPAKSERHARWVEDLIDRLEWSIGRLPDTDEPTTPEEVLDYLDDHPFVFLTSKTGAGKSHFVQKILPDFGKETGKPIKIYHEMKAIKDWLLHSEESQPVLFLDEANLANEHFALFEAVARGDKVFWFEGEPYPLKNHKIIFAGNPKQYEGRFEPDLLKHFPNYLPFQGERLDKILNPLLSNYENSRELFDLINTYYTQAQDAGLNITPRNAQMMCLRFFILKESIQTRLFSDDFLMRYAILNEIKTLSLDKELVQDIRKDIKQSDTWVKDKTELKEVIQPVLPETKDKQFIWTASRRKIALAIDTLMMIRDKKIKGVFKQEYGINGLILEGEPGLGKSKLVSTLLQSKGIDYVNIPPTNPMEMQKKLIEAFHKGQVVVVDEFNTLVHEQLLNALLSGYDLDGNPPQTTGFCLIGTQNPITFHNRQPLSKALDNRLMLFLLSHYNLDEFKKILVEKFELSPDEAQKMTEEYLQARDYALSKGLFPPPNTRNLMTKAEKEQIHQNQIQVK